MVQNIKQELLKLLYRELEVNPDDEGLAQFIGEIEADGLSELEMQNVLAMRAL